MAFNITKREFYLSLVFAVLGLFFTTSQYIEYRIGLSPLVGLLLTYVLLYITLFTLSKLGLIIWNMATFDFKQLAGILLILFSFMLITDWVSIYYISQSYIDPNVIIPQSEGGAVYYIWDNLVGIEGENQLRVLTFILTPFFLSLTGSLFLSRKVSI